LTRGIWGAEWLLPAVSRKRRDHRPATREATSAEADRTMRWKPSRVSGASFARVGTSAPSGTSSASV